MISLYRWLEKRYNPPGFVWRYRFPGRTPFFEMGGGKMVLFPFFGENLGPSTVGLCANMLPWEKAANYSGKKSLVHVTVLS